MREMPKANLWGISVYENDFESACKQIEDEAVKMKSSLLITAYSEFFVAATRDDEFRKLLENSWMVVPDGVSVLAAIDFEARSRDLSAIMRLWNGFRTAGKILNGYYHPISGVKLFEELIKTASSKQQSVFLLGGKSGVVEKVIEKIKTKYPNLNIAGDEGEAVVGKDISTALRVVEKIEKFQPNYLFVAYGPVRQEKWLEQMRKTLKFGVGVGVGGTFDEYLGNFPKAPKFLEEHGLKWFWRLLVDPARIGRIYNAVIVFPYLVFKRGS